MTGYSQLTQFSPLFHSKVTYYSQSKVAIHLSKQINPAINKSEGLSKVIMWPGYKEFLVFLEIQNA